MREKRNVTLTTNEGIRSVTLSTNEGYKKCGTLSKMSDMRNVALSVQNE